MKTDFVSFASCACAPSCAFCAPSCAFCVPSCPFCDAFAASWGSYPSAKGRVAASGVLQRIYTCSLHTFGGVYRQIRPSPFTQIRGEKSCAKFTFSSLAQVNLDLRLTPNFSSPNRFQRHNMPLLALGHKMALSLLTRGVAGPFG